MSGLRKWRLVVEEILDDKEVDRIEYPVQEVDSGTYFFDLFSMAYEAADMTTRYLYG